MDERLQKMNRLFEAVADLRPSLRAEHLDRECDDAAMRAEMEALLAAHDDSTPTSAIADSQAPPEDDPAMPSQIGPYRISHRLGTGGMGIVYHGTRDEDGRRAAIKVIKRGMDTEAILKRFKLERQVLAVLNHPNIARMYDGGETDDGLPYFATEFIDGLPLDDYCDTHRLTVAERLQLFRKVCDAVQYAHQNLIVHRDLKPTNILVTERGEPKLLDFGIAKLLQPGLMPEAVPTAPEMRAMTPEYASPEQVRGHPVTTSSDIYSLGVLLYELVSGHRPYELRTRILAEIERVICEEDPLRPSDLVTRTVEVPNLKEPGGTTTISPATVCRARESRPDRLRRSLAGDIDNIVLKAMRKEPQRRYATAEQFGEDLHRHLTGLPVTARGDTLSYRCSKFVRRNRTAVAAALAFAVLLLAGIAGTASGWRAEAAARQRADVRFAQVRALAHTFIYDFHDSIVRIEGTLPARQLLVETALEYLEELSADLGDDPELDDEIADAYVRIGDYRGGKRGSEMGDTTGARENYEAALAIRESLLAARPADPGRMADVSVCLLRIGDVQLRMGAMADAADSYERGRAIAEEIARDNPRYRRLLMFQVNNIGKVASARGRLAEARSSYERGLELSLALAQPPHDDAAARRRSLRDVSVSHIRIAEVADAAGDHRTALEHYLESLDIRRRLVDEEGDSTSRRDVTIPQMFAARSLIGLGAPEEGVAHVNAAAATLEEQISASPEDARLKRTRAYLLDIDGRTLIALGDHTAAREQFERMQSLGIVLSQSDPENASNRELIAVSYRGLGEALVGLGSPDQAAAAYRAALGIADELLAKEPEARQVRELQAELLLELGVLAGELDLVERANSAYADMMLTMADYAIVRRGRAKTLCRLAVLVADRGDVGTARTHLDRALKVLGPGTVHADAIIRREIDTERERLGL